MQYLARRFKEAIIRIYYFPLFKYFVQSNSEYVSQALNLCTIFSSKESRGIQMSMPLCKNSKGVCSNGQAFPFFFLFQASGRNVAHEMFHRDKPRALALFY